MKTIPHLSRDGQVMHEYDPDRSIFRRSCFWLDDEQFVEDEDRLARAVKAAGVNALELGLYRSPAYSGITTMDRFVADWRHGHRGFDQRMALLDRLGLGCVAIGDDVMRTPAERDAVLNGPIGKASLQYVVQAFAESGLCSGIEMVDEITHILTLAQMDIAWTIRGWMVDVPGCPGLTFPPLGIATLEEVKAWMGEGSPSDYATIYGTPWAAPTFAERYAYAQLRAFYDRTVVAWEPALDPERPKIMAVAMMGEEYERRSVAPYYQRGQDKLRSVTTPAIMVGAQIMYALARGMAGVRCYAFEPWHVQRERHAPPPMTEKRQIIPTVFQTGAHPWLVGTDRWDSMAAAFRFIAAHEPLCLMPMATPPELGEHIVAGVHEGELGRLTVAVNFSERAEQIEVDAAGERHVFGDEYVDIQTVPGMSRDTVALGPGESAAWVDT